MNTGRKAYQNNRFPRRLDNCGNWKYFDIERGRQTPSTLQLLKPQLLWMIGRIEINIEMESKPSHPEILLC